jgi:hypothetical protein
MKVQVKRPRRKKENGIQQDDERITGLHVGFGVGFFWMYQLVAFSRHW